MNPVGVYLPVSEVFPGTKSETTTLKSLLEGLSLTDALFWCSRLNLVIANPLVDHRTKQQYGLDIFFDSNQIIQINNFVKKHGGADRVIIFFRGQLLELIRWACLFCKDKQDDGVTFEKPEVRSTFARAALIASDIWARRVFGNRFSLEGGLDIARERGLGAIRQSVADSSSGIDPMAALGRGYSLFCEHFPKFYPGMEEEFRSKTNLSLEEYYICVCALMSSCVNRTPERVAEDTKQSGIFHIDTFCNPAPHMKPLLSAYFALESQTIAELKTSLWGDGNKTIQEKAVPYDYKALRQRPILQASDSRAIVIDPVFYAERASVGPLFLLSVGETGGKANKIFGAFGDAFESYAGNILRRMYPSGNSNLVKRLTCNAKGKDRRGNEVQITDALLDDVTEVVLFEMKAAWIPEETILDDHYERYLDSLRSRYGVDTSRKERPKGVAQSANAISKLATGEWLPTDRDFSTVQKIYPVLLVHDPFLDAPIHSHFLASEFRKALQPDDTSQGGDMRKGPFRVAPLIILTIKDLEDLETSIENFSLRDLLQDYSSSCIDRVVSLHNFVAATPKYNQRLRHNKSIASSSLEVLGKTMEAAFPGSRKLE